MPVLRARTLAVLRRLRAAGALSKPRRRVGRIPRKNPPIAIGNAYARGIVGSVMVSARGLFSEVERQVLELLASRRRDIGHADAGPVKGLSSAERLGREAAERELAQIGSELAAAQWQGARAAQLIDGVARQFARRLRPDALINLARRFGEKTDRHARGQLDRQLRAAVGVPLSSIEKPTQDRIGGWVAENAALIKTVPERYFDRLQEDVQEAFAGGAHPDTLAAQFEERYEMSARDAERLARDQVLKLSAQVGRDRAEAIGVERAVWRTMRDNRVSDDCFDREGEEFDLADGLDGEFPGETAHPLCRCWSEFLLDDLLGIGET